MKWSPGRAREFSLASQWIGLVNSLYPASHFLAPFWLMAPTVTYASQTVCTPQTQSALWEHVSHETQREVSYATYVSSSWENSIPLPVTIKCLLTTQSLSKSKSVFFLDSSLILDLWYGCTGHAQGYVQSTVSFAFVFCCFVFYFF